MKDNLNLVTGILIRTANSLEFQHLEVSSLEDLFADIFRSQLYCPYELSFGTLLEIAAEKNSNGRIYAIRALGGLKDRRAIKPLIKILKEADESPGDGIIISCIAKALGNIGDSEAVLVINYYLSQVQRSNYNSYKDDLIRTLLVLPPSLSSIECLKKIITESDHETNAIIALKNIKDPKAVETLIMLIENRFSRNHYKDDLTFLMDQEAYYLFIVEKIGLNTLLSTMKWPRCFPNTAISALYDIQDHYACDSILNLLNSENENMQILGILALRKFSEDQITLRLIEMLNDKNFRVQKEVIESLGLIGNMTAVHHLIELLKNKNKNIKKFSSIALKRITKKKFIFRSSSYKVWHNWFLINNQYSE